MLAVLVALDQQVGGGDGVGARVVVLAEDLDRGLLVVGTNPVLASASMPPVPQAGSQMVTIMPAWVSTWVSGSSSRLTISG